MLQTFWFYKIETSIVGSKDFGLEVFSIVAIFLFIPILVIHLACSLLAFELVLIGLIGFQFKLLNVGVFS